MLNALSAFRRHQQKLTSSRYFTASFLWFSFLGIFACSSVESPGSSEGPSSARTAAQALKTFQLEPGLKIELVASEPMVQDPVVITFDEDGRLWVVEMRGFMPDIEGKGERDPLGRVSVLEDNDGDGVMDKSTVWLDSLIMPRSLAIVNRQVLLVAEEALWITSDINGDLRADTKTLIDSAYTNSKLPEHAANGLWRGMDNWYYNAKSRLRYRPTKNEWIRDSTEFRGQWGISHDDAGRLFYNYNWSQLHADLVPPNQFSRNRNHTAVSGIDHGLTLDRRIFPIRPTPAVNRGYIPGILDEKGRLQEFTAACAPLVYRGSAMPRFYGNAFVCEPSGNLIKRNEVVQEGLHLAARDPHTGKEFLASTDERFRPVYLTTGPDGALYVADMYRGLIQHGAYVTPYLREQTLARKLDQPVHYGRIYRIVPNDWEAPGKIMLSNLSTPELVDLLSHPDGWYRDNAQRLLVERNDKNAVEPLAALVLKGKNELAKVHALWTLEGLQLTEPDLLLQALDDRSPVVTGTALRLLQPLAATNANTRSSLENVLLQQWRHSPVEHILHIALVAPVLREEVAHRLLKEIATHYDSSALVRDAILSSLQDQEFTFLQMLLKAKEWQTRKQSREIFLEMLTSAIVRKRDAGELEALVTRLDVNRSQHGWQEEVMLNAMAIQGYSGKIKPVRLRKAPAILSRKDLAISPAHIENVSLLFEWPGPAKRDTTSNNGKRLTGTEKEQFALGRKYYLSTCSGCHGNDGAGVRRFAPPLKGSEWVLGDEKRLSLIVLHGIEGALEVAGVRYDEPEILPVMPGHSTLDDNSIAAILTYIRNAWGHEAGAVSRRTVGSTRLTTQGRVVPWTSGELDRYMEESKAE
jgi:mono/diheme cytochrome c family protein/glucose/arabinose dehydrogenase